MQITYTISLWNFLHYAGMPGLERTLALVREQGFGIEMWSPHAYGVHIWRLWPDEEHLFSEPGRGELRRMLAGTKVSYHAAGVRSLAEHRDQIDAARDLGAGIMVVHPGDLTLAADRTRPNLSLCREVVAYAADQGVQVALENGQLPFLVEAVENVADLRICLDVGHVYLTNEPMSRFLDALKARIIHLHLQEIWSPPEVGLPLTIKDHYTPGSGGIPPEDWRLLAQSLEEIDYRGLAVFEIQPRNPFQTATLAKTFFDKLLGAV